MVQLIVYEISCGHKVSGPTTLVSGLLYCPWHHDRFGIVDVVTLEWQAKCVTCRYARWAGMSEQTGNVFANGHVRRNPGHRVGVWLRTNPEAVKTKEKLDDWQVRGS